MFLFGCYDNHCFVVVRSCIVAHDCHGYASFMCCNFFVVPGLLEHHSIPSITSSNPLNWHKQVKQTDGNVTVETVMQFLLSVHKVLTRASVGPGAIDQIFKQVGQHFFENKLV